VIHSAVRPFARQSLPFCTTKRRKAPATPAVRHPARRIEALIGAHCQTFSIESCPLENGLRFVFTGLLASKPVKTKEKIGSGGSGPNRLSRGPNVIVDFLFDQRHFIRKPIKLIAPYSIAFRASTLASRNFGQRSNAPGVVTKYQSSP
jgi:hypothetical protein